MYSMRHPSAQLGVPSPDTEKNFAKHKKPSATSPLGHLIPHCANRDPGVGRRLSNISFGLFDVAGAPRGGGGGPNMPNVYTVEMGGGSKNIGFSQNNSFQ